MGLPVDIRHYLDLGLTVIPLVYRSKKPLVRWGEGWNPRTSDLERYFLRPANVAVLCGQSLAALDFDSKEIYFNFITKHQLPPGYVVVKTARGYHIWVKPRKAIRSQVVDGIEIKCLGSYIVAPPSIHPNGKPYVFEVPPNGSIPEVDLEVLFNLPREEPAMKADQATGRGPISDFALRYGKSPFPQSMCGKATKIFTRSDDKVKKLVSLRCWKWDCPKCAHLLKRYWLNKLGGIPFRFIINLPTQDKPTAFLRRVGKPGYLHIVANGESWLFLNDGDADKVRTEARQAGYKTVAGGISEGLSADQVRNFLDLALCMEKVPLNTRRKITHSRGMMMKKDDKGTAYESKEKAGVEQNNTSFGSHQEKGSIIWQSEVVIKPVADIAKELEQDGWQVLWKSEVEAIAFKSVATKGIGLDIVELLTNLGVKLKKVGKEWVGLCPFHCEEGPSLYVNREKGLWHCFGRNCGRGGNADKFLEEWKKLRC